ncbi:MAG: hypothetical protein JHC87_01795 [Thermoleophilaceae bacterium]|nr:hypothetical protein [Thermoleophilaceae bacterium]
MAFESALGPLATEATASEAREVLYEIRNLLPPEPLNDLDANSDDPVKVSTRSRPLYMRHEPQLILINGFTSGTFDLLTGSRSLVVDIDNPQIAMRGGIQLEFFHNAQNALGGFQSFQSGVMVTENANDLQTAFWNCYDLDQGGGNFVAVGNLAAEHTRWWIDIPPGANGYRLSYVEFAENPGGAGELRIQVGETSMKLIETLPRQVTVVGDTSVIVANPVTIANTLTVGNTVSISGSVFGTVNQSATSRQGKHAVDGRTYAYTSSSVAANALVTGTTRTLIDVSTGLTPSSSSYMSLHKIKAVCDVAFTLHYSIGEVSTLMRPWAAVPATAVLDTAGNTKYRAEWIEEIGARYGLWHIKMGATASADLKVTDVFTAAR